MNYNVRVSFRATENEARILRAIQQKRGAETLSEALRLAVNTAGEALSLTQNERREETAHV